MACIVFYNFIHFDFDYDYRYYSGCYYFNRRKRKTNRGLFFLRFVVVNEISCLIFK